MDSYITCPYQIADHYSDHMGDQCLGVKMAKAKNMNDWW